MLPLSTMICGALLAISSLTIFILSLKLTRLKTKHLDLTQRHEKDPSFETRMLLSDILSGSALVRIERLEPENFLLRRK